MTDQQKQFMQQAIDLAKSGMEAGKGGPFGCVIVKDGKVVGQGSNLVTSNTDPTAHAEVIAIRDACKNLNHFQLEGCELYTSCEPCPMCLGAIYWARPSRVFYACSHDEAAEAGFDDSFIYEEIQIKPEKRKIPMTQMMNEESKKVFELWSEIEDRKVY